MANDFDDDYHSDEDYYQWPYDWDDDDDEGCCLGDACLNPHFYHTSDECFDLEMAEQLFAEQN